MIRKGFVSLDLALARASYFANSAPDGSRTVCVWGRTTKRGERYDVLDLGDTPKGDGWQKLYKVERCEED